MNDVIIPEIDLSQYKITPKFEEWRRLYLDKTNKETFGNATRSVLIAYNLDATTQYGSARVIGHENLTKLNNLQVIVQEYMTENGFTLPVMIAHALKMMTDPKVKTTHWWKELMITAGYKKERADIAIQNNTQINMNKVTQVTPEEEAELTAEFTEFLEYKRKNATLPIDSHQEAG